jgi:hypothetical protein
LPRGRSQEQDRTWLPWLASCITRSCGNGAVMSSGVDVPIDGWGIRGRWFGVIVGVTRRLGVLRRGEMIPWHVIAAQIAPRERSGLR